MNATAKAPTATRVNPPKRHKAKSLDRKKAKAGYFFVAPFILIFLIVYLPVIVSSIQFSFNKLINTQSGYQLIPVGWENYNDALFVDPHFVTKLTGGIEQLILEVPAIVIFSLFMAVLLNQKMVGRTVFRAIFFIPVILSTGLIDDIDMNNAFASYAESSVDEGTATAAMGQAGGLVSAMDLQSIFSTMKVGTELVDYVVQLVNDVYQIVNRSGVQMLIFLAGLQSISPAIYESCRVEGATAWETFWKITFPMISPMILVNTIYTVIDSFTSSSNSVMNYVASVYSGTEGGDVLASAMYWIYFMIVILIIAAVAGILSAYVFYQKRD